MSSLSTVKKFSEDLREWKDLFASELERFTKENRTSIEEIQGYITRCVIPLRNLGLEVLMSRWCMY